ncbi:4Fe-4S binding protein [Sulfuracidifex metallicus]|nr:4Fe-4S binding protein [Sulfuracidifex metallicus]WOE51963.1 4Fe-4S binding protein [Sulfuracidifex metallicus DSM 6482 = JCM 9184]
MGANSSLFTLFSRYFSLAAVAMGSLTATSLGWIYALIAGISLGLLMNSAYINRNKGTGEELKLELTLLASSFIALVSLLTLRYLSLLDLPLALTFVIKAPQVKSYIRDRRVAFTFLVTSFASFLSLSYLFGFFTGNTPSPAFGLFPVYLFPFDLISIVAGITGSSNFSVVFGLGLLTVVLYKMKEIKKLSNRVRMGLMLLAYFVYSTYIPDFSPISSSVQYIPYMWFNGLGTYGGIEPSLLVGILGTFAVTSAISYMFGSRQICSVTCTAPYMLQGPFMDSMKRYNRTSTLGRKTLTSRLATWYKAIMWATWSSLLAAAILSYLNYLGVTDVSILGNDPTVFYVILYFNFLWYVQFLLMPYFGNYACVNHGICTWGSFNQLFGYLGPFKLKVKDPSTCLTCKTVDCAKACPVGLTDMRSSFIKKGEFKSFKCIGVGECIDDCPHDNIFIYDIRNVVKERLGFNKI